jgi:high-affinity nickel-transport protein
MWRAFRIRSDEKADAPAGLLSRLLRPFVAMIAHPWQMYPLGFLFGLGFDTASEVSLLGVSASAASHAASIWTVMVFPALFTAGMVLIDTTDGLLMKAAYGWAQVKPQRKLAYNFTITLISILMAFFVGGLEALNLIANRFSSMGGFWRGVRDVNDHFGAIGCIVTVALVGCWTVSWQLSRSSQQQQTL